MEDIMNLYTEKRVASPYKWTDANLPLPKEVALSFDGAPQKIVLQVGTEICRMRTNQLNAKGASTLESPFWFPRQTLNTIFDRAARAKVRITTAARSGLAVRSDWNEYFDTLVIFLLLRPGFAWAGPARWQLWKEGGTTILPGGLPQLWIPGLEESEVRFTYFGNQIND
jgi:hypothetical protein